ncbi:MAG: CpsD/CapB family tyrosine-protein kinase [Proteobacteria bacterium]|nr:CpsD/CapB family tyrosine-protein kinase [Pseudomonadota bacterium]MBU1648133.1 CpsD/CapB family tyrosine-protein kinase [Pseudomonadota bacterium]
MSVIPKRQEKHRGVLLLEKLHDQFLSLVLEKLNPGHESSLSLCVSSCRQGEGASTVSFNMAIALSLKSIDRRILLVDGNIRSPILHSWLKIAPEIPGLVDVLEGKARFEEVLKRDESSVFSFIAAGRKTENPIVLFDSKAFDNFLAQARAQFDIIIFDSVDLMTGPETSVLARKLDGLIMVIEAEKTRWEVATYHKQQLADAGVCFTGAILNKKKMFIPRLVYRLLLAD